MHARSQTVTTAKGSVLLLHGLAEHSGRYGHVIEALNSADYNVSAPDLRGHGRSDGWPGKVDGLADWLEDVGSYYEKLRSGSEGRPFFVLGHSLGAMIAAAFVAKAADPPDGLVLSGYAGLAGAELVEAMGDPDRPFPAEMISRDPAVVKAYVDDPLVFHDDISPECNAAALEAAIEANQAAPSITVPTLMVHGTNDAIADIEGAREFYEALGSRDKELLVYEGLYHEVMNEPEKEQVLDDIVRWLDRHV